MLIGIDASRAFQKNRTGIEEYSYQVIKHLIPLLENEEVVLYIKKAQSAKLKAQNQNLKLKTDFILPDNWKVKVIKFPFLWTQIGLSLEMIFHPVDVLFVPSHVVPLVSAKNTIVTIHGLEYEFCPKAYSFWAKVYMRWAIKRSCRIAKKIIAVSENTKKDLINLYKVPEEKIEVIYEGVNENFEFPISNFETNYNFKNSNLKIDSKFKIQNSKFILFIGRLEERKNILGILEAYKILKEKYNIPHCLVLAGSPGHNYKHIKSKIAEYSKNSTLQNPTIVAKCRMREIVELGFVSEEEKRELLKNADVFLFPTFYEGFGLPILEAQSVGVPVVASDNSSIPEIVCHSERSEESQSLNNKSDYSSGSFANAQDDSCSALLVNPSNSEQIAEATYKLISDENLRKEMIERGYKNVKRFSWSKCAEEIAKILK